MVQLVRKFAFPNFIVSRKMFVSSRIQKKRVFSMPGLYLHIPFCKTRCAYCDFFSTTCGGGQRAEFVRALCRELALRREEARGEVLSTVYFGGGTPSQLSAEEVRSIFCAIRENYVLCPDAEITMEVNPDDVTEEYISALRAAGVNRISMGVQTFQEELLRVINRRHTAEQARSAVRIIRSAGIDNISIDLIYGLPGQTLAMWECDVQAAIGLKPTHISAYALSYEEGTPLYARLLKGEICETDEEVSLAMYRHLISSLEKAGFLHYEISNFALPGFRSRHNSSYWTGIPYIGVGPGAHSYDGACRRANLPDLKAYVEANGDAPCEMEKLSEDERFNESLMLSLRTREGLDLDRLKKNFGREKTEWLLSSAEKFLRSTALERTPTHLRLTPSGIFLSDAILRDLFV